MKALLTPLFQVNPTTQPNTAHIIDDIIWLAKKVISYTGKIIAIEKKGYRINKQGFYSLLFIGKSTTFNLVFQLGSSTLFPEDEDFINTHRVYIDVYDFIDASWLTTLLLEQFEQLEFHDEISH